MEVLHGCMGISLTSGRIFSSLENTFTPKVCSLTHSRLILHTHRGGDFLPRQANGEHPKQLNYSRAFGGKDLKKYGLIAEPDVSHFEILPEDKLVVIASDGNSITFIYLLYVPCGLFSNKIHFVLPNIQLNRAMGCSEP